MSRPSSTRARLHERARLLAGIRGFFADRGVLEVETPALSASGVTDVAIDALRVSAPVLGAAWYLHTSPEYAMKRLLAAGSGDIYQLCRVFRDGELGRWHEPEFTLLEWYRIGWSDAELMDEVDALLTQLLGARCGLEPSVRLSYAEAFDDALGVDPHGGAEALRDVLPGRGVDVPTALEDDALLDLALSSVVVPGLAPNRLTFVHGYPAGQAALAEIEPGDPPVAARFEVFGRGIELANGYRELTDAAEQRRRFERDRTRRRAQGRHAPPLDEAFLAALEAGMPPAAGVALGVDRLAALATGAAGLSDVTAFAHFSP